MGILVNLPFTESVCQAVREGGKKEIGERKSDTEKERMRQREYQSESERALGRHSCQKQTNTNTRPRTGEPQSQLSQAGVKFGTAL